MPLLENKVAVVTGVNTDISKLVDLDRLYEAVAKKGKIDVIFADAGLVEKMLTTAATPEHFDKTFNTNARGTYFTVQKALPHLNDGASIILVASAGKNKGLPGRSTYSATKAALRSFARAPSASRGNRFRSSVPRLRPKQLRHRYRPAGRRRPDGCLDRST